ncbi:MAG TPA: beta-L-arabinofuranosidase domain-containing protein [Candidatus Acidoferrum sp.]|nr:beta-L-arabinofuranosidase domain-containing protein [Candidatus Acidoferrum sp.]
MGKPKISRREFAYSTSAAALGLATRNSWLRGALADAAEITAPLQEFAYGDVALASEIHKQQLAETHAVLMGLSEDSLLKPFRQMSGLPAPGEELGGWYRYDPNYDWHKDDAGFAPAATFGQWVSALARAYAINGDKKVREKVLRLNRLYAQTISADFYAKNRFPAYCYDKLVCGLMDAHRLASDPDAFRILEQTTDTAVPLLPGKAIEHGQSWRPGTDESYTWDESYTMPENLFLVYQQGAGERYRALGQQYLDEAYFAPLAEGRSNFAGRHAYSHVNALCSAMQAYLTLGSEKHLRAAKNGFDLLTAQSFATGGWGPDETLRAPDSDDVFASLSKTHNSFETPCGAYAHFKLTRYLLRVTRDPRYGDSMERIMYNTVLGAKPLQSDGRSFYYSDYHFGARKVYSNHRWPCCSGTLPQVASDYGISSYLRDAGGVYVNLYIPSTARWVQDGVQVSLTQNGSYPFDSRIGFALKASRASEFALSFRIPAWTRGASIFVNGKRVPDAVAPGKFATVRRQWKSGDLIDLELPLKNGLEPIDARHNDSVALLCGPLVLFAIAPDRVAGVTREALLSARKSGEKSWRVETADGPLKMLPFTSISDQQYFTYLTVS